MTPVKLSELGDLEHLAEGGQAIVYQAPQARLPGINVPLVFKKYRSNDVVGREVALLHGLSRLIEMRDQITSVQIDRYAVWPLAVVVKDDAPDEACGFLMRQLPGSCFIDVQLLSGVRRKTWEVVQLLQSDEELNDRGIPILDDRQRLTFLGRLTGFVSVLHRHRLVLGDFSARNVIVRPDPVPAQGYHPMLVDVDTCRVVGEGSAIPQAHTPEWQPPEALIALNRLAQMQDDDPGNPEVIRQIALCNAQNQSSDVYKVALLALRLFHVGDGHTGVRESDSARARLQGLLTPQRCDVIWSALEAESRDRPSMADLSQAIAGRVL